MKNKIVLYGPVALAEHIEVRIDEATVWLNRQQLSDLFNRDVKTIGKYINNVFAEGEPDEKATVAKFATGRVNSFIILLTPLKLATQLVFNTFKVSNSPDAT